MKTMTEGKITIKINEKGEMVIETHGIHGPACMEEVNILLEEMAAITEVNKTDEYYLRPKTLFKTDVRKEVRQ